MKKILLFTTMALALIVGAFGVIKVGAFVPDDDILAYKSDQFTDAWCNNDTLTYFIVSNHVNDALNEFVMYSTFDGQDSYTPFSSIYGNSYTCPVIYAVGVSTHGYDYEDNLTACINMFNDAYRFLMEHQNYGSIYTNVNTIDSFQCFINYMGVICYVNVSCGSDDHTCVIDSYFQVSLYQDRSGLISYWESMRSNFNYYHTTLFSQDTALNEYQNGYIQGFADGKDSVDVQSITDRSYNYGYSDGYDALQADMDSMQSSYESTIASKDATIADLNSQLQSDDRINFKFYDLLNNIFKFPVKAVHKIFYNEVPIVDDNNEVVVDSFGNVQYEATTPISLFGVDLIGVVIGVISIGLCIGIIVVLKKVWK